MKFKTFILSSLLISSSVVLNALPIGNPWEASLLTEGVFCEASCGDPCTASWCDSLSYRFGYYGDFVFDRHLESREDSGTIRQTQIETNAAFLALNFCERVDLFGTLGASYFEIETPGRVFLANDNDLDYLETETYFSWSIGGRATVWECGCFGVGLEGQYFYSRPRLNFLHEVDEDPSYLDGERFRYQEWQIGVGAAYRVCLCNYAVVPYIGLKWAHAYIDMGNIDVPVDQDTETLVDLGSNRDFGYAVGLTLVGWDKFALTLEKRFLDERAFYFNAQIRF